MAYFEVLCWRDIKNEGSPDKPGDYWVSFKKGELCGTALQAPYFCTGNLTFHQFMNAYPMYFNCMKTVHLNTDRSEDQQHIYVDTHTWFTIMYDDYDLVEECSILSGDYIPKYYLEKNPRGPISENLVMINSSTKTILLIEVKK